MLRFLVYAAVLTYAYAAVEKAVVVLKTDAIEGRVTFTKTPEGVKVEGTISGLAAGKHGFHIHDKGDLGDKCVAAGPHFNPAKKDHGARTDDNRHVGDLGNIEADNKKVATFSFVDSVIALEGENSIIGRALVIHEGEDDLGLGGYEDSKTTGHAGARLTCGVVGIAEEASGGMFTTASLFLLAVSMYLTNKI